MGISPLQLFSFDPRQAPINARQQGTLPEGINGDSVYQLPFQAGSYTVNGVAGSVDDRLDNSNFLVRQAEGTLRSQPTSSAQVPTTFLGVDFTKIGFDFNNTGKNTSLLVNSVAPPTEAPDTPDAFAGRIQHYEVSEQNAANLVANSTFEIPGLGRNGLGIQVEQFGDGLKVNVDANGNIQLVSDAAGGIANVRLDTNLRSVQDQTLAANDGLRGLDQAAISIGATYGFGAPNEAEARAIAGRQALGLEPVEVTDKNRLAPDTLKLDSISDEKQALLKRLQQAAQGVLPQQQQISTVNNPFALGGLDPRTQLGLEPLDAAATGPNASLQVEQAKQIAASQAGLDVTLQPKTASVIQELTTATVLRQLQAQAQQQVAQVPMNDTSRMLDGRMPFIAYLPGAETDFQQRPGHMSQQGLIAGAFEDTVGKRSPGMGAYSPAFAGGGQSGSQQQQSGQQQAEQQQQELLERFQKRLKPFVA